MCVTHLLPYGQELIIYTWVADLENIFMGGGGCGREGRESSLCHFGIQADAGMLSCTNHITHVKVMKEILFLEQVFTLNGKHMVVS